MPLFIFPSRQLNDALPVLMLVPRVQISSFLFPFQWYNDDHPGNQINSSQHQCQIYLLIYLVKLSINLSINIFEHLLCANYCLQPGKIQIYKRCKDYYSYPRICNITGEIRDICFPPQDICSLLLLTPPPSNAFSLVPLLNYISPNAFILTISTGDSSVFLGLHSMYYSYAHLFLKNLWKPTRD